MQSERNGALFRKFVYVLIALFLLYAAGLVLRPGGDAGVKLFSNFAQVLFAVTAMGFGFKAAQAIGLRHPRGKFIAGMSIAVAFEALGMVLWTYLETFGGEVSPFPSLADAGWLLSIAFTLIAFSYLLWHLRTFITGNLLMLSLATFVLICAVAYSSVLSTDFSGNMLTPVQRAISLAYPVGHLLIALQAILVALVAGNSATGVLFRVFFSAALVNSAAWLIYSTQTHQGTYQTGDFTDLIWQAARLLFAYGFYLQLRSLDSGNG